MLKLGKICVEDSFVTGELDDAIYTTKNITSNLMIALFRQGVND
jgi:hypothetical protein